MMITLILIVCLLTCAGQLCQKQAVHSWIANPTSVWRKIRSPWLLTALCFMGGGMALWLVVLRFVPLGTAYPMLSLNFILVTLAARLFFNEKTDGLYWIGVAVIVAGVVLLGGDA